MYTSVIEEKSKHFAFDVSGNLWSCRELNYTNVILNLTQSYSRLQIHNKMMYNIK